MHLFYSNISIFTISNTCFESKVSSSGRILYLLVYVLRCYATIRKVADSIPDGIIGIFHLHHPSDRTIALGSTKPLTEMSTRSISWGKGGPCVRPINYHHPVLLSRNLGALTSWNPLGLSTPVIGLLSLYLYWYNYTTPVRTTVFLKMNPYVRYMQKTLYKLKYHFNKGAFCWFVSSVYIRAHGTKDKKNNS